MSCTHRIVAYIEENPFRQGWRAMVKRHIGKLKHAPPEHQTSENSRYCLICSASSKRRPRSLLEAAGFREVEGRVLAIANGMPALVGHALACLRLMRKSEKHRDRTPDLLILCVRKSTPDVGSFRLPKLDFLRPNTYQGER